MPDYLQTSICVHIVHTFHLHYSDTFAFACRLRTNAESVNAPIAGFRVLLCSPTKWLSTGISLNVLRSTANIAKPHYRHSWSNAAKWTRANCLPHHDGLLLVVVVQTTECAKLRDFFPINFPTLKCHNWNRYSQSIWSLALFARPPCASVLES